MFNSHAPSLRKSEGGFCPVTHSVHPCIIFSIVGQWTYIYFCRGMMSVEIIFKSNTKSIVNVDNDIIRISRKGLFNLALQGLKGEKSIPIRNITAIQLKKPGVTTGYIQFSQHGMMESKGGVTDAVTDENTILFSSKKDYAQAQELKAYIERVQAKQNQSPSVEVKSSDADELLKFKQLLDAGAINEDEYEAKKKQILGL